MIMQFLYLVLFAMLIYQNGEDVFVTKKSFVFSTLFMLLSIYFAATQLRDIALQVPYVYSMLVGVIQLALSAIFYQTAEARDDDFDKVFWGLFGVVAVGNIIGSAM